MANSVWILHSPEKDIPITKPQFTAGRSSNLDIICKSNKVSRNHAVFIVLQDGTLQVKDNSSINGTFINRQRITTNVLYELHVNDEVGLGVHSQTQISSDRRCKLYVYNVRKGEPEILVNDNSPDIPAAAGPGARTCAAAVNDNPPAMVNGNSPAAVNDNPPTMVNGNSLAAVNDNNPPAVVNSNPPAAVNDNRPAMVNDNNPPAVVNSSSPVVVDDSPPAMVNGNSPAAVNDNNPPAVVNSNPSVVVNDNPPDAAGILQGADDGLTSQELLNILDSDDSIGELNDSNGISENAHSSTLVVQQKEAQSVANTRSRTCKRSVAIKTIVKPATSKPSTSRENRSLNVKNKSLQRAKKDQEELKRVLSESLSSKKNENGAAVDVKPSTSRENLSRSSKKNENGPAINVRPSTSRENHSKSSKKIEKGAAVDVKPSTSRENHSRSAKKNESGAAIDVIPSTSREYHSRSSKKNESGAAIDVKPSTSRENHSRSSKKNESGAAIDVKPSTSRENHSLNVKNNILHHAKKDQEEVELALGESRSSKKNQDGAAIQVKQEPFAVNDSHDNRYTIEDGCIVIDDDDDDFPCSQFLENNVSNINSDKPEAVNDSIFCAIKLEVEELDRLPDGAVLNPVTVDSDTDTNSDWLNDLQEDMDIQEDDELELVSTNPTDPKQDKVADAANNETPSSSRNSWTAKNKYVKPPVVDPHFEVKHSSRRNGDALLGKRKSVEEENIETKKMKTNHSLDPRLHKKSLEHPQKHSATKEATENLREIRKKHLREVAEKNKNDKVTKMPKSKIAAAAKVKVSEGRGNFLTENLAVPSTSKGVGSHLVASAIFNNRRSNLMKNGRIPRLPRQESAVSNDACQTRANHNVVRENNNEIPQFSRQMSNIPASGVQGNEARPVHTSANITRAPINFSEVEDVLVQMISWNIKWFEEKGAHDKLGVPPVNKEPLMQMAKSFKNFSEYSRVVLPLMIVDLWYFLFKEISGQHNDPRKERFLAMVEGELNCRNYVILDCTTYISKKQFDQHHHVKEEDVMVLQYCFILEGRVCSVPRLGYVTQVNKKILKGDDFIDRDFADCLNASPQVLVNFQVMLKPSKGVVQTNRYIKVRVVTSAVSTLRIFKSVKHLEHSELCPYVLNPSVELYKLPRVSCKKLFSKDNLNNIQLKAVMEASAMCTREKPGIFLIQGPPGTGKTTVIINIIQQILFCDGVNTQRCILVVAPSNGAVDELVSRILTLKTKLSPEHRQELKLIRIGPKNSVNPLVQNYLLSEMAKRNIYKYLKQHAPAEHKKTINSLQQQIATLQNNTSTEAQSKLAELHRDIDRLARKLLGRSYNYQIKKSEETLLNGARIICTTLSSCVGVRITEVFQETSRKITCCIVDEATQSNEQESLIPLKLGINKMVLVGDPKQLPAVTLGKEAKDNGFGQSLFSRIMVNFQNKGKANPIIMLNMQYRMHPEICRYPNQEFYNNQLTNAPNVIERKSPLNVLVPYRVFNCDLEFNNSQEYRSRSEINCVLKLVDAIVMKMENSCSFTIGIITPYNHQRSAISDELKSRTFRSNVAINVNTVDSFQGQERDIIIMSCVREYSNNFIRDEHRLNVALTRAKHALYIIGSANLFKTCEVLGKVYDDALKRRLVVNIKTNIPMNRLSTFICK